MGKSKKQSQCKILHPTLKEVQTRFDSELFHKIEGDFENDGFVASKTLVLLKEWESKGIRTDNLLQSKERMRLIELASNCEANLMVAKLEIARRNRLDLNKPSELAIHNAVQEVEKIGADERLTNAVILLLKAKDLVSNYIDEKIKL